MGFKNILWQGSSVKQDSSNRLVTDNEKTTWNNKANSSHTHTKAEVGLGNVDNTADSAKSVKYATSAGSTSNVTDVGVGSDNKSRHVWFSNTNPETSRVYSDKFQYNPATDILTVGSITGSAQKAIQDSASQQITTTYIKGLSVSGRTITYTKGDNTTGTITTQDTNTDTKVTQSAIKSSDYTNWRPIIWGSSNSASEGFTPTTVTDGVFSDPNLTYQPSSGTLRATVFKGKLSGTADAANSVAWGNVSGKPSTYAPSSHTHNYAGSNSAGGAANFVAGGPASVTSEAYRHVWFSDAGTETARCYNDSFKYDPKSNTLTVNITGSANSVPWSGVTDKPSTFTPSAHNHDTEYLKLSGGDMTGKITFNKLGSSYISAGDLDSAPEVGAGLANLVISSWSGVSFTTSCKDQAYTNKTAVSIDCRNSIVKADYFKGLAENSNKLGGYGGSSSSAASTYVLRDSAKFVYLNYINSDTPNNENPNISQIIVTNGDNYYRKASLDHLRIWLDTSTMINKLSVGTSDPVDSDFYIAQYANGGDTTTTYHRRSHSALWNYIKSKANSVYAASSHTHTKSQITDFPTSLPASDVYSWAKASAKPSYSKSEVGLGNVDNTADKNKSVNYANSAGSASRVPDSGEGTGNMARHVWFSNTNPETSRVYSDKIQYNPATDVLTVGSITGSASSVPWSGVTGKPTSLKNPNSLTITVDGGDTGSAFAEAYDGSEAKSFQLASGNHDHNLTYLALNGGTMTGTLSLKNTGLQIISNLPEDFSGTPRGNRQVLWYSREFEDDSYKYEDYCTHYINLGTPNNGSGNGKFGVSVQVRFYTEHDNYHTDIHYNTGLKNNINVSLPANSGTLQVSSSDAKLKTNIKDTEVNDAISFINKIHLHSFDWKTDDTHQPIGFIADELKELDERLSVGGNSDKVDENGLPIDPKCVNTFYLQGYEVKAIQELSNKVDTLEKENNELKDIINQLLERVTTLENK